MVLLARISIWGRADKPRRIALKEFVRSVDPVILHVAPSQELVRAFERRNRNIVDVESWNKGGVNTLFFTPPPGKKQLFDGVWQGRGGQGMETHSFSISDGFKKEDEEENNTQ